MRFIRIILSTKFSFYLLLCLLLSISPASFSNPINNNHNLYSFNSTVTANRFYSLIKEIRCVVCQNQNIADSNAPLANDLRDKIYQMIIKNKSDDDIKKYLIKRYGEFILLQPLFTLKTALLWTFPLTALIFIFLWGISNWSSHD